MIESRARESIPDLLSVPPARREAIEALERELTGGRTIALTTHISADGDGCGSQAALARLLRQRGITAYIVNPTPWPEMYQFLLGDDVEDRSELGAVALRGIDALVTLDISDVKRLGALADTVRGMRVPRLVIDHHLPSDEPPGELLLDDTTACATGELVYDLARVLELEITREIAVGLYCALLTDTGGFRFSNTTPRCHAIAGQLLAVGVDPEAMYRRIYASVPLGRVRFLAEALGVLKSDPQYGITWIAVPAGSLERHGLKSEDLDGVVEHARSVAGTRLALFLRDLGHGMVKVSFRSTGEVDVNRFARQFGGGGHAKASGAMIPGALPDVEARVVEAAREFVGRVRGG